MITMDPEFETIHHGALQRQARQRVDRVDDLRAAKNAADRELSQRDIADLLLTSQAKVHRMLKTIERRGGNLEPEPEEIILRAFAYGTNRGQLLETLKSFTYTFGQSAPYPHEGRLPGTWDQVVAAYTQELLTGEEFDEVRAAVGR